jgi:hypothetical protein
MEARSKGESKPREQGITARDKLGMSKTRALETSKELGSHRIAFTGKE